MACGAHGRYAKPTNASLAIKPTVAFDRCNGNSKGFDDLSLRCSAIDDELCGKETKAGDVVALVCEDRQMSVEINDLVATAFKGQVVVNDLCTVWKNGQLHLRHEKSFPPLQPAQQAEKQVSAALISSGSFYQIEFTHFPQPAATHRVRSGVLSLSITQPVAHFEKRLIIRAAS